RRQLLDVGVALVDHSLREAVGGEDHRRAFRGSCQGIGQHLGQPVQVSRGEVPVGREPKAFYPTLQCFAGRRLVGVGRDLAAVRGEADHRHVLDTVGDDLVGGGADGRVGVEHADVDAGVYTATLQLLADEFRLATGRGRQRRTASDRAIALYRTPRDVFGWRPPENALDERRHLLEGFGTAETDQEHGAFHVTHRATSSDRLFRLFHPHRTGRTPRNGR